MRHDPGGFCCFLYGRLRPGIAPEQAEAQMNGLVSQIDHMFHGKDDGQRRERPRIIITPATALGQPDSEGKTVVTFVLAAVSLVLLIACANVASLLLARSAVRQKEVAIRLAIGAGRGRLVRQLLTESALMSMLAGVMGMVFAWWALHFLMVQVAGSLTKFWGVIMLHIAPDQRVFAYTFVLSCIASVAFGLAPALQATKPNLTFALKEEGVAFAPHLRKSRLRDLMVATQVAVCLVLLIVAGLLTRGSQRALTVDLGFDDKNLIVLEIHRAGATKDDNAQMLAIRRRLISRIEGLPGVVSVTSASRAPLAGGVRELSYSLDGHAPDAENAPQAYYTLISQNYFETLGIPIIRGRGFTLQDISDGTSVEGSPVIVSETTSRKLWPGQDPIGKRISLGPHHYEVPFPGELIPRSTSSIVIGVAKDVRSVDLEKVDEASLYLPVPPAWGVQIIARTRGDSQPVILALRRELPMSDSNIEGFLQDLRGWLTFQPKFVLARLGAIGSAIIGIFGLLMASVGIYGSVGFAVSQRTHEVGVRMSLGASAGDVLTLMLRETMLPVAIGLGVGLAGAAIVSRLMSSLLFALGTLDPVAFLGVSAFLAAVAVLAGYLPARRATKVDPMVALRYE
jgi:putative ABC transport system permease protein